MPPRTALSTPLRRWRCPQCYRPFTTTTQSNATFRPEHPRFIDLPEPPQQNLPYHRPIKGRLPVPRPIFHGKDALSHLETHIAKTTREPAESAPAPPGSQLAWKQNLSAARRRNLREGLYDLKARMLGARARASLKAKAESEDRHARRTAPQREDERLTTPSHGLDLQQLLHSRILPDPTRAARLKAKSRNFELASAAKKASRAEHLHTLHTHARRFIVTPAQLDAAIEEEFRPDKFAAAGRFAGAPGRSMWDFGAPVTVGQMLAGAGAGGQGGLGSAVVAPQEERSLKRVGRIAGKLMGGKLGR